MHKIRWICITFTFLLLTGCVGGATLPLVENDYKFPKKEKEGVIFLSVDALGTDASSIVLLIYPHNKQDKKDELRVIAVPNKDGTWRHSRNTGGNDSQNIIITSLPPGKYDMRSWTMFIGNRYLYPKQVTDSFIFTVKEGNANYIGNLVIRINHDNTKSSTNVYNKNERDIPLFKQDMPAFNAGKIRQSLMIKVPFY